MKRNNVDFKSEQSQLCDGESLCAQISQPIHQDDDLQVQLPPSNCPQYRWRRMYFRPGRTVYASDNNGIYKYNIRQKSWVFVLYTNATYTTLADRRQDTYEQRNSIAKLKQHMLPFEHFHVQDIWHCSSLSLLRDFFYCFFFVLKLLYLFVYSVHIVFVCLSR